MAIKQVITRPHFIDLLQLMFIYLKLTNQINWHWVLVLLPYIALLVWTIVSSVQKDMKGKA